MLGKTIFLDQQQQKNSRRKDHMCSYKDQRSTQRLFMSARNVLQKLNQCLPNNSATFGQSLTNKVNICWGFTKIDPKKFKRVFGHSKISKQHIKRNGELLKEAGKHGPYW